MNIQELAKQAGFIVDNDSEKYQPQCIQATHSLIDEPLKKFALLVAEHEREECAKLCDNWECDEDFVDNIADAIRARGKT